MNNNVIDLAGFVGGTPLIRSTRYGKFFATFSMATTEYWPGTRNVKRTTWHNVIVWDPKLVSYVQKYIKKGSPIEVQGSTVTSKYEKDGTMRTSTKVEATSITALTKQMLKLNRELEKKEYGSDEKKGTFIIRFFESEINDEGLYY
jgi:single-strand DNA-binding protein